MNGLALCAGVGGIELGLRLALGPQYQTVGYVERDSYAAATLVARMEEKALDPAPVWDDLETFDGSAWRGKVDLITAGFPCQPFSTASRGRKRAQNLWPGVHETIEAILPEWVFLENVLRDPIKRASDDLRAVGYRTQGDPYCPSELGSAMRRPRWWLLAHRDHQDEPGISLHEALASTQEIVHPDWRHAPNHSFLGVDDGSTSRVDRLRCLGNGVVPAVAARAFTTLLNRFPQ